MTATGEDRTGARMEGRPVGPWWWERWRGAVLDGALAFVSAVECSVEGVAFAGDAGLPAAVGVVFGALAGSVLLVRRMWPVAVVLVFIAVAPAQMGYLMGLVGLYTLAASEAPNDHWMAGSVTVASTDPSETYRVAHVATTNTLAAATAAIGASTVKAPNATATPLPPMKRSQIG